VVTITINAGHGLGAIGTVVDGVTIAGFTIGTSGNANFTRYNGIFTVTVTSSTTFTYSPTAGGVGNNVFNTSIDKVGVTAQGPAVLALALSPRFSVLTSIAGYAGANNTVTDPALLDMYCNGSRETPEYVPVIVPGNPRSLQVGATADEGNNYITLRYGPLYMTKPGTTGPVAFGDYHLSAGSPAVNAGTTVSAITKDIDGDDRGTTASGAYDIGADEFVSRQTADLAITKTDGVTTVRPGNTLTYTIVVTNNGPSTVTGAVVADARPAEISSWAWTCAPTGVAGCGGTNNNGTGNISKTLGTLASGASVTFAVVSTVSNTATAGPLTNTATVTVPSTILDSNPANNSATDTDTIVVNAASLTGTPAFGDQQVDVQSTAHTFTYTNTGNGTLILAAIPVTVTGGNASSYVVSANVCTAGLSLAPNATCTFNVAFSPTGTLSRNATLTVVDSAGGAPNPTLALTGTGTPTLGTLNAVAFGNQLTNSASAAKTSTFTYTGAGTVTLASNAVAITGGNANQFAQTNTCNGATLSTGSSCTISVSFAPTSNGQKSANLTVGTDTATLTGTAGTTANQSVTPGGTLAFGTVTRGSSSTAQMVTVTNTGFTAITVTSIGFTGNAGYWTQSNTCGASIAVNGSCTIGVSFTPPAAGTVGAHNSALSVVDAVATTSKTVTGTAN
jgi:hypothetical protein